jgi:uncharacterized protein (DUF885 family)
LSVKTGHELGLYEQPLELRALPFELHRACRLVADTVLHTRDWIRAQAILRFSSCAPKLTRWLLMQLSVTGAGGVAAS